MADSNSPTSDPRLNNDRALLENLQREAAKLHALLERVNDHWVIEDGMYRFYYQSFKVYYLQHATAEIVAMLTALAPEGRTLCDFFMEVVRAGTGRAFKSEDNTHWVESTLPITTAFLHARYFLEMACKYAELTEAPSMLPSGWAALLCLYGIR